MNPDGSERRARQGPNDTLPNKEDHTKNGVREIARLASVSIATVDRALNDRKGISERTRARILKIADSIGYRPNLAARILSAGPSRIPIGVCIPRQLHPYFDHLRNGIEDEAARHEHFGVEVLYNLTEALGVHEIEKVSELIEQGVRLLIVTPGDPESLQPIIDTAEASNVRVICVDTDAPRSNRSSVVCADAEVCGKLAAQLMGNMLPQESEVAIITGMLNVENHRRKAEGFRTLFSKLCTQGQVVEVVEAHEDEDEAFQRAFNLLMKYPALSGIYVNTGNSIPVCKALGACGRSGKVKLIGTELSRDMVPYFRKGTIFATINGRPFAQGQVAVRQAVDYLRRSVPMPKFRYLAPQIVLDANLHLFREVQPVRRAGAPDLAGEDLRR